MGTTGRAAGIAIALLVGCSDPAPSGPPAWSKELPPATAFGAQRGLQAVRGIIHLHSPFSHDACDGMPRDEQSGAVDEDCLADLREALCTTRVGYAALTEHDDSMADEAFEDLYAPRGDDEIVRDGSGAAIASRIHCDNGHEVLWFTGGENELMPLMLDAHPAGSVSERHDIYNAYDATTSQLFRDLGGLSWVAHTEGRSVDELRALDLDGLELYNLHANIDPNIREQDLGLDPATAIQAAAEFADPNPDGPEPDLALIAFLEPSLAVDRWDTLLGEGLRISASAGTDAHQNSLPIAMRDGERGDSYRRMIRWFSNVVLVSDPSDPAAIEQALAAGRMYVAFELFGTPAGFDMVASGPGGDVEIGGEVDSSDGATLNVTLPVVYGLDPSLPAPAIRGRILRVDATGTTEVAAGDGMLTTALDSPGAYRVEVLITPYHHAPYLGRLDEHAEREQVWIYSNPIYVN